LGSNQRHVALFANTSWAAREIPSNKVQRLCRPLRYGIAMVVPRQFVVDVDTKVLCGDDCCQDDSIEYIFGLDWFGFLGEGDGFSFG